MAETNGRRDVRRFPGQTGPSQATMSAAPHGDCESQRRGYMSEDLSSLHGIREEGEGQEQPDTQG